ncbi:MAG: VIT domain-containing protein [Candidatus Accumulibacter phosphatis]|jgi:hypothetical protein|uniref:VIT domain-containing protein n=1 Tax=Candidatus Accumulibacter contiguus TaxID=2954381 RepID=A0ABX1TFK0_9PROT|nr:VIT domain-containing protein [Candidatus Accumulibacter contiguus]NMQ07143.1 hypothetical protein [Candidatus Accumulibacter contiguus]
MSIPDQERHGVPEAMLPPPGREQDKSSRWFILLAGVILPAFTLAYEAYTQASAQSFFDPIPSLLHGLLIALVPLANAWVLVELAQPCVRASASLAWLHSVAMGIAAFYALLYLPLTPAAPFMVLFYGIGLLPLAPLLSLLAAWRGRVLLNRRLTDQGSARLPAAWRGWVLAMLALIVIDLPFTLTRIGVQMATSAQVESRQAGIRWLRALGNEEMLRHLCYSRTGLSADLIGLLLILGDPVSPIEARKVYYQVTGQAFNDLPEPAIRGLRDWQRGFDRDIGGRVVGSRLTGVRLAASRIDGSVDAKASLAYLEWTMVLQNDTTRQQEGRAQIALPAGAVVSRLTLWIDGEEREAAFGTRAQTRQAYEKVVRRRQDPVLVTTAGQDRVMVQMFPIPPNAGEMKIRLGITVPLRISDGKLARLQLPAFRERNFDIGPKLFHSVWLEADSPLSGAEPLRPERVSDAGYALRGEIDNEKLGGRTTWIDVPRNPLLRTVWSDDTGAGPGRVIVQRYQEQLVQPPQRLALVVDASSSLAPAAREIVAALARLPGALELGFFPATDIASTASGAMTAEQAAKALQGLEFAGGQNNPEALARAWDWAAAGSPAAILWLHGPQPMLLGSVEPLLQYAERRPGRVRLYSLEVIPGPNKVLEALDLLPAVLPTNRSDGLQADLERLFTTWAPGTTETLVHREQLASAAIVHDPATKTSGHLARLWAADQIRRLLEQGEPGRQAATDLALRYHLVTPVSGAVVLETSQQYDEAGLRPVEKGSVPTIPEPEEWMLIATVLVLLACLLLRRRQAWPTRPA